MLCYPVAKDFPKMAYDPTEPRLVDRSVEEIQQIEDRLSQIQAEFREIRQEMQSNSMAKAKMTLGTVNMLLDKLAPLATKVRGQFRTELTKRDVAAVRERKKAERSGKPKKGT